MTETPKDVEALAEQIAPSVLPCARCTTEMPAHQMRTIADLKFCPTCASQTCEDCGIFGGSVMPRMDPNKTLCAPCSAKYPGRDWMRKSAQVLEEMQARGLSF